MDTVRRSETNKAKKKHLKIIKGERFNLLRHSENLTLEQLTSLRELFTLNKNLAKTYLLKEDFRQLWDCTTYYEAYTFLKSWYLKCVESDLQPFIRFAEGLLVAKKEIGNILEYKYTNGSMEAFNGIVVRIIGRGYGYRDTRYLFLKCRQQSCST